MNFRLSYFSYCLLALLCLNISGIHSADAATLPKLVNCVTSKGQILVRANKCKRGETLLNVPALQAIQPVNEGPTGADGQLRIYGNGSRGDYLATTGILNYLDSPNLQFENFTVPASTTLIVPSGAVIRVRGNFVNNGFIFAENGAVFSTSFGNVPTTPNYFGHSAQSGGFDSVSTGGAVISASAPSGSGARGMTVNVSNQARVAVRIQTLGGGPGGNGSGAGGNGGGSMTFLVKGSFNNVGTIGATGGSSFAGSSSCGGGGGGGGMIVLASMSSITNSGSILANGGTGASATSTQVSTSALACGAGGGSGGGLVQILAPAINDTGTINVAAGAPGSVPLSSITYSSATSFSATSGGGGGGCFGGGGNGTTVTANSSTKVIQFAAATASSNGEAGLVVKTLTDPTSLF